MRHLAEQLQLAYNLDSVLVIHSDWWAHRVDLNADDIMIRRRNPTTLDLDRFISQELIHTLEGYDRVRSGCRTVDHLRR